MKKRIVCILLTLIMLVSLVPMAAVTASAASSMNTSEDAIKILKQMEGYRKYAYQDNSQWSIGYGSSCGQSEYPNGITEAQADELLQAEIEKIEKTLNSFIDRYSLTLTQNKFDALVLFSYNVGTGWTSADGRFRQSVIDGDTGNDFLYTITLWSNINRTPSEGLIKRRLAEADMYLNGSYVTTGKQRSNYTYVLLDNNGGFNDDEVQGYDSNVLTTVEPVPTYTGYRFMGWYTEKTGGTWVTALNADTAGKTLYAHWQKDEGTVGTDGAIQGTEISYSRPASAAASLNVYENPGSSAKVIDTLTAAETMEIVAEYVDSTSNKWGELASGGWVNLGSATDPIYSGLSVEVTVTNTYVNVRSAAGAHNNKLGQVNKGDKLVITEVTTLDGNKWGKLSTGGWIALMYTDYEVALENAGSDSAEVIATGTVSCSTYLNVRSGAGVNYAHVGSLATGTEVKIYQITTVNGHDWGRIYSGWICLDYVTLDQEVEDTPDTPETSEDQETGGLVVASGTVKVADILNVRSGPGVQYNKVGSLKNGQRVDMTEMTLVNGHVWGKIDIGWICLTYVTLDYIATPEEPEEPEETTPTEPDETTPSEPEETTPSEPEETTPSEPEETTPSEPAETTPTEPETPKVSTGVVANANVVNVREAAGCRNDIVTTLKRGEKVNVYEQITVDDAPWARIDQGWICMYYVQLDQTSSDEIVGSGDKVSATGTVSSNGALNIRSGPGTNYAKVGALVRGTKVEIYEQTKVNGVLWGRIDKGWICLSYVVLNSTGTGNEQGQMGTVVRCFSALNIRSAPGTFNALVGTIRVNSRVEIYEIVDLNGDKWGRIDQGWVSMYYILLDSELPGYEAPETTPTEPEETTPSTEPEETTPSEPEETTPSEPEETTPSEPEETTPSEPEETTPTEPEETTPSEPEETTPSEPEETTPSEPEETTPSEPEETTPTEPEDEDVVIEYLTGTVINAPNGLKVRENAGTHYDQVGTLANGTKVKIYDLVVYNGLAWGQVDQGWICLSYVDIDPISEDGIDVRITAKEVNPRVDAGYDQETVKAYDEDGNIVEVVYSCGTLVEIYETKQVGNATWGLTVYGWINYADTQDT